MSTLTQKQWDEVEPRVHAHDDYVVANSNNNAPGYVSQRTWDLHKDGRRPLPVRQGAGVADGDRLFLIDPGKRRPQSVEYFPGAGGGIEVKLFSEQTGEFSLHRVEIDGNNGVVVVR